MNESRAKTCGEGECVCVCNFHHNICVLAALPVVMWHALCHNSLTQAAVRTCTASLRRWSSTCWPLSSSTSRTARELQPVVLGIAQEEDVLSPWSRRGPDPLSLFPSKEYVDLLCDLFATFGTWINTPVSPALRPCLVCKVGGFGRVFETAFRGRPGV